MVSIIKIIAIVIIVIALMWLLLARPVFSLKDSHSVDQSAVDADKLKEHVEKLSIAFHPRSYQYPENLNRVAQYIAMRFQSTGATVREQVYAVNDTEYRNIIAEYGPESQDIIVIGAHYDTAGKQPGADDNASVIAGLLELSQLISQEVLHSQLVLVAFTLEEPPFFATDRMGSAVYAKSLAENRVSVKLMISLEMIGYYTDEKNSQQYPTPLLKLFYPSTGHFIAVVDQFFSMQARQVKRSMRQVMELPV